MIQWMHALSKSWMASILMGGLALSFVVWGIADVFTGQTDTSQATVGSTEISSNVFMRSYRIFVRNQSQLMGMEITAEMAQKMNLRQIALQQLVSRTALDNMTTKLGLGVSDAALAQSVRALPAFKGATGQFDHNTFLQVVQNAGYSEPEFLAEMRSEAVRQQLTDAIEGKFALPAGYARALYLYLTEQRAADYVILSPEQLGAVPPPDDATLAAYVKAHANRFSTPEYRQIEFAQVSPEDVVSKVNVTDKMIADEYNTHKALYVIPEKRDVQQIEFPSEAEAAAAHDKLAKGGDFAALAAMRNIKPADLSLGSLTREDFSDKPRCDAVFSLGVNEISQPVKGALSGFVLLRVTKITPGVSHSLEESSEGIKKTLALQLAQNKLTDVVNAFEDARSGGADIATAAKKTGMKAGKVAAIDRSGLAPDGQKTDAPTDPEFLAQAFQAEVGEDSDPFPVKSGWYYTVKVDGVTPPKLKPMAEIKDVAVAAWTAEQKIKALGEKATAMTVQASKDGDLAGIARALKVPVQKSPALSHGTNDTMFSAAVITKLFNAPAGGVVSGPQGTGGNYIIAKVTGIAHPEPPSQAVFDNGRTQISGQMAGDLTVSFANAARAQQGVKVNQKLLDQAVGQ